MIPNRLTNLHILSSKNTTFSIPVHTTSLVDPKNTEVLCCHLIQNLVKHVFS